MRSPFAGGKAVSGYVNSLLSVYAVGGYSMGVKNAIGDSVTDDWAAIQDAIDAAANSVLFIPPCDGFYNVGSTLNITRPITIVGLGGELRTSANVSLFKIQSDNVRILGPLTLTGPGYLTYNDNSRAIEIAGSVSDYLADIEISGLTIDTWKGYGILATFVTGLDVTDNTVRHINYGAILGSSVANFRVTNNTVQTVVGAAGAAYGIQFTSNFVANPTAAVSQSGVISDNYVDDVTNWAALGVHGAQSVDISGNTVTNSAVGVDVVGSKSSLTDDYVGYGPKAINVIGNVIDSGVLDGSASYGISFAGIPGVNSGTTTDFATGQIVGNHVRGYGPDNASALNGGIFARDTLGLVIVGNRFEMCSPFAVALGANNYGLQINGNTFLDSWSNVSTVPGGIAFRSTYNTGTIGPNTELRAHPTTLSADATAGDSTIKIASTKGWCVGDPIKVDVGGTVESFTVAGVGWNEIQILTISATGGTYTLTFGGQTTTALAFNASAATVQAALEALSSINAGNVSVTKPGLTWNVEFIGTLSYTNIALMTANAASLTGGSHSVTIATHEGAPAITLSGTLAHNHSSGAVVSIATNVMVRGTQLSTVDTNSSFEYIAGYSESTNLTGGGFANRSQKTMGVGLGQIGGTAISKILTGTAVWNPGSIADGATATTTVTVTGALASATSPSVIVNHSGVGTGDGVTFRGAVTADNTVTVTLVNASGGNFDLATGTVRVTVIQF